MMERHDSGFCHCGKFVFGFWQCFLFWAVLIHDVLCFDRFFFFPLSRYWFWPKPFVVSGWFTQSWQSGLGRRIGKMSDACGEVKYVGWSPETKWTDTELDMSGNRTLCDFILKMASTLAQCFPINPSSDATCMIQDTDISEWNAASNVWCFNNDWTR